MTGQVPALLSRRYVHPRLDSKNFEKNSIYPFEPISQLSPVELFEFLKLFYTLFFVWLTCLTAIFVFRRHLPSSYRWFVVFIILVSVIETVANYLAFKLIKNHFLFNVIFALELTFIPLFFKCWLRQPAIKKLITGYLFIFLTLVFANTIWFQGFYTMQTYTYALGGSFVLFLSFVYLRELYIDEETQNIFRNPLFWFSIAFLIHFAVNIPYFGMLNYLVKNQLKFATKYYLLIMDGAICLYNILLTVGFLCMKAKVR